MTTSKNKTVGELLEGVIPNFKADLTKDVTYAYIVLTGHHPNSLTLVIIGHLLIEHLLNKIILGRCKNPNKIIKYSFSVKVDILNSMALLPEDVYKNIRKLNTIRNKIVHTLEVDLNGKDMDFYKSGGAKITIKKPKFGDYEKHYLKMLSSGILISLRNHMLVTLKISPNFNL